MFIFLDPLEFSPELFADGESQIRGLQTQRDRWDHLGWSGMKHRVWILLKQPCFTYGIWTGILTGIKILILHLRLFLDIHGYIQISIFLHWPFQELQITTLGTCSLQARLLSTQQPLNLWSPADFLGILTEVYANHSIRDLMTEVTSGVTIWFWDWFYTRLLKSRKVLLFSAQPRFTQVFYGVCRLWHIKFQMKIHHMSAVSSQFTSKVHISLYL